MWNLFCIIFIHWNHYCRQKMCMKHPGNHVHWCFSIVYRPIIRWREGSSISAIFTTSLWTIRHAGGLLVPEGIICLVVYSLIHLIYMLMKRSGNHIHLYLWIVHWPIAVWCLGRSISAMFMTSLWAIRHAGGLSVPEGIIRLVVSTSALTWFIRYI